MWTRGNAPTTSSTRRFPPTRRCKARSRRADGTRLLAAYKLSDEIGQLSYKVWYYVALKYDEDQRDNEMNARRQQVQILFAKFAQASAWFSPELLSIPLPTVQGWMAKNPELAVYRFAIEDLYRQQEHVLDEKGEHLLSLASRFSSAPYDAYAALSTADVKHPTVRLSNGTEVTLTYGQYRAILATNRQSTRSRGGLRRVPQAVRSQRQHVCLAVQRRSAARLVPRAVTRLSNDARRGAARQQHPDDGRREPDRDDESGDRAAAPVSPAAQAGPRARRVSRLRHDAFRWWMSTEKYPYDDVLEWLPASVAPLGPDYQRQLREALNSGWIDVYENPGKRSGAYSAPVYGVHPYMLLNHNDTLDAVFTLAHEVGHSMHTLLSHAHQPFVYSDYTIFIAEVPSTLSEALFLEYMLEQARSDRERIVLLQHAIDGIVGTFYTQVMFADYELQAHRLVEDGQPVTSERLSEIYFNLFKTYHGDAIGLRRSVARDLGAHPAFLQHAVLRLSVRHLLCVERAADEAADRRLRTGETDAAIDRYLTLLKSGGSDHPMTLLQRAGVDLSRPEPVRAVVEQLDALVTRLEHEITSQAEN